MRRLSASFEEMEKVKLEMSQGHRRISSSSSSFTSGISQENFPPDRAYEASQDRQESYLKNRAFHLLSQTDDLLELGAEGN